jgi:hypothetical protein
MTVAGDLQVVDCQDVVLSRPRPDFTEESLRPDGLGELGIEHLEGHQPVVLEVPCEEDPRHAATPKLALDGVGGQAGLQDSAEIGHTAPGGGDA